MMNSVNFVHTSWRYINIKMYIYKRDKILQNPQITSVNVQQARNTSNMNKVNKDCYQSQSL